MRLWGPRGAFAGAMLMPGHSFHRHLLSIRRAQTVLFTGDAQILLLEASGDGIPKESPPATGFREVSVALSGKRIVILGLLATCHPGPLQVPSFSLDFLLLPGKYGLC